MLKLLSELGARWTTFISAARAACAAASSENPAALATADVAALAAASLGLPVAPPRSSVPLPLPLNTAAIVDLGAMPESEQRVLRAPFLEAQAAR